MPGIRDFTLKGLDWLTRRVRKQSASTTEFYPTTEFCQIAGLGHLLELYLGRRNSGTFVEVGANDGIYVSNTWGPATRGWRGIMVEPVLELARQCEVNHRGHPNVTVVHSAVGPPSVEQIEIHVAGALSTASTEVLAEYKDLDWARGQLMGLRTVVPCVTLDSLLADMDVNSGFDLLVVDVEGFEKQVFEGFDLSRWKPLMMIVELTDSHQTLRSRALDDARLQDFIVQNGYAIVYKDSANTVFVRQDVRLRVLNDSD